MLTYDIFRITPKAVEYVDTTYGDVRSFIGDHYLYDSPEGERYLVIKRSEPDRVFAVWTVHNKKELR